VSRGQWAMSWGGWETRFVDARQREKSVLLLAVLRKVHVRCTEIQPHSNAERDFQ
jgi:hypothetical protein